MTLLSDLDHNQNGTAEPKATHTIMIIVGALAILWLLGAVTFKGIRQ
jgi:hypothetical protein